MEVCVATLLSVVDIADESTRRCHLIEDEIARALNSRNDPELMIKHLRKAIAEAVDLRGFAAFERADAEKRLAEVVTEA